MEKNDLIVLQKELLNTFKAFVDACNKANLSYFLIFGSLIGAVRHNGFIPWDDDIDVAMPRKDYNRFIELYKDFLATDYYLDGYKCNKYQSNSPLLRLNSKKVSIRRDRNGVENYIPAFVGIFPIDGLPSDPKQRNSHIRKIMFRYGLLRASRASIYGLGTINNRTFKENIIVQLNKLVKIGRIIKPRDAARKVDEYMAKYPLEGSKYCHIMDYDRLKSYYFTEDFSDRMLIKFEDTMAYIPRGFDRILRDYYGDYMQLPPKEKQIPRHGIEIIVNK